MDEKTDEEKGAEGEPNGDSHDDPSEFLRQPGESAAAFASRILERVFNRDIEKLLRIEASQAVGYNTLTS